MTQNTIIQLTTPMTPQQAQQLHAGDRVQISGIIYTARDAAHLRLCQLIEQGKPLPFDLNNAIIYFVGPTPAAPNQVIGAAGPTTSSRMDAFSPTLYAQGLRATIGKGYRSNQVRQALQANHAIHFAALGGAGALLSKCITAVEIIAYEELGTEAIRKLTVKNFPATVAYDTQGQSIYPT